MEQTMLAVSHAEDFAEWALQNAALLRSSNPQEADLANIADELELLGMIEHQALQNRIEKAIRYLLQMNREGRKGREAQFLFTRQREGLKRLFAKSPSLRKDLTSAFLATCYAAAIIRLQADFPDTYCSPLCPYGWSDILPS